MILGPTYKRACYLEGTVTDASTGASLVNAEILIEEIDIADYSNATGSYKFGTVHADTYQVTFSKEGYHSQTLQGVMENGVLSLVDVALVPRQRFNLTGRAIDKSTRQALSDVIVIISDTDNSTQLKSDADGSLGGFSNFAGDYQVVAAKWGHKYVVDTLTLSNELADNELVIELEQGYEDIFELDLGWQTKFDGDRGGWVRVNPISNIVPGTPFVVSPEEDSDDFGSRAFVTGQSEVFDFGRLIGTATLESPLMDLSSYEDPILTFDYWLWTSDLLLNPVELPLTLSLSNAADDTVVIAEIKLESENEMPSWKGTMQYNLKDYINLTEEFKVGLYVQNEEFVNILEAGVDNVKIFEAGSLASEDIQELLPIEVFPNPSSSSFVVKLTDSMRQPNYQVSLYDSRGALVEKPTIGLGQTSVTLGSNLVPGIYMLKVASDQGVTRVKKLIKQ